MCILLVTTAHPNYPLILLSNRDEFLSRPTARAAFWEPPYSHVFSGRDLARPERGTWLGITRTGRLAVLTNLSESSSAAAIGKKSRGAMVTSFLTSSSNTTETTGISGLSTGDWLHGLLSSGELKDVGGFSLFCGVLRPKLPAQNGMLEELVVISNRAPVGEGAAETEAHWIAGTKGETHGLSNSLFDNPWPKVKLGQQLLSRAVEIAAKEGVLEDVLVDRLFGVLSHDVFPGLDGTGSYKALLDALKHSVFIPIINVSAEPPTEKPKEVLVLPQDVYPEGETPSLLKGGDRKESEHANGGGNGGTGDVLPTQMPWWQGRKYGTQQQTVILVDKNGRVKYVERTLWDENAEPLEEGERDVMGEWSIEGWGE